MSWLSHFTGWVGEKKNTLLPIVTGLAGFAAGMIPGIGGVVSKQLDKWGNKISGVVDAVSPASPDSPAVAAVEPPTAPTTASPSDLGNANHPNKPVPAAGDNRPLLIGGAVVLAALLFGGGRRR